MDEIKSNEKGDGYGILVVRHGSTYDGVDYSIFQNSHGKRWGDARLSYIKGNIRLAYGRLGISVNAWYPIIETPTVKNFSVSSRCHLFICYIL